MPVYNSKDRQEMVMVEVPVIRSREAFPATEGGISGLFELYAREWHGPAGLAADWPTLLGQCLAEVNVFNEFSTEVINKKRDFRFPTLQSLINFLNSEVPNTGVAFAADCTIRFYSVVDGSLPSINRIFAFNKFYACLLGTARNTARTVDSLRSSAVSLYDAIDPDRLLNGSNNTRAMWVRDPADPFIEYFISETWRRLWGETLGVDVPAYNTDDTSRRNWLSTMWFQVDKSKGKIYRLPATDKGLSIFMGHVNSYDPVVAPSIAQRTTVNSTPTFVNAKHFENFEIKKAILCSIPITSKAELPPDLNSLDWAQLNETNPGQYSAGDSRSFIIVYGVQSGDRRAMYVKPFGGPDTFCIPKFDTSLYQLEVIRMSNKRRESIYTFDVANFNSSHTFYSFRMPKTQFYLSAGNRNNFERSSIRDRFKFFVRKKGTEFVSALSSAYISCRFQRIGEGANALVYEVEYDRG